MSSSTCESSCFLSPTLTEQTLVPRKKSFGGRERTFTGTRVVSLCLIGDKSCGKTALAHRISQNNFKAHTPSTLGGVYLTTRHMDHTGQQCILNVRDTSGDETFRSVVPIFYRGVEVIIFTFDLTSRSTFNSLPYWSSHLKRNEPQHLHTLILCGTKLDLVLDDTEKRQVTTQEGEKMATKLGCVSYFETSARTGTNVMSMKNLISIESSKAENFFTDFQQQVTDCKTSIRLSERTMSQSHVPSRRKCNV